MDQSFKESLIEQLIANGVYKGEDGQQLYELNVIELLKLVNKIENDHYHFGK
ncbi:MULTISPECIES: Fur-regulated basic protein FbpA [Aeribacillus]|uniref:Fur-regulated basic protein FbpA n=1 Tax=Aeribacillus TaxID=1055323 RepID=UPI002E249DB2|nr:Fur-regulated basic protein FbpA [Aeribacillus composti]MED0716110.1 Fur-regulated basic protein FbpA [Aeribacillus composti]MED0746210.1 Fur-regulated basic protein FbpA [Aeribacillus composti]